MPALLPLPLARPLSTLSLTLGLVHCLRRLDPETASQSARRLPMPSLLSLFSSLLGLALVLLFLLFPRLRQRLVDLLRRQFRLLARLTQPGRLLRA